MSRFALATPPEPKKTDQSWCCRKFPSQTDEMLWLEPPAHKSHHPYPCRLAGGLAHAVNILDPDVIVLGGGLSEVDELYTDLPARIAPFVFSDAFDTPVRPSRHGSSSGVRGAAWLWME